MGIWGMPLSISDSVGVSARAVFIWRMLAAMVIAALLARWTWVLFAPQSASMPPAVQPASDFQAEHLFGIAAVSVVPSVVTQVPLPNVRLIGVFAGKPGFAILELDGKQVGLTIGKEIVAGAKLVEVAIDHVVIERGGAREQIQLEGRASALQRAASAAVNPVSTAPVNAAQLKQDAN